MNAWIYRMMVWRRQIASVATRLVRLTEPDRRRAHWHPSARRWDEVLPRAYIPVSNESREPRSAGKW